METIDNEVLDFAQKALNYHIRHITEDVFMEIEHTPALMRQYQRLIERWVEATGSASRESLRELRSDIDNAIRDMLNLGDIAINKNPNSLLLETYTEHALKKSIKKK